MWFQYNWVFYQELSGSPSNCYRFGIFSLSFFNYHSRLLNSTPLLYNIPILTFPLFQLIQDLFPFLYKTAIFPFMFLAKIRMMCSSTFWILSFSMYYAKVLIVNYVIFLLFNWVRFLNSPIRCGMYFVS